jgi:hypothetical protein
VGITVINSDRKIRQFLVYDFEWIPGAMQIRLCGCYDGEEFRCYATVDDFLLGELNSKNRGRWFYAHAGGLADIQFVFEKLSQEGSGYTVQASTSGSSVIICHVRKGKNVWHFVDSYWLLRASLEQIGKWIGMYKGQNVSGWETMTKEQKRRWYEECPIGELRTYNERDCCILWNAIHEFQCEILELGGQLQMTQASCAMQLFRRRFLAADIPTSRQVNEIARLAYVASRVEVFEQECTDAHYFDINSSFPHSMTKPQPGVVSGWGSKLPDHGIYLAKVKVYVPDMYMPPLPVRMNGRIFFPTGMWESWFSNVDLELLQREGGKILRVDQVITFEPFEDLRAYSEEIYKIKKKADATGDTFKREVAKLLMNSCYGKFAESPFKRQVHINPDAELFENGRLNRGEYLFPGVYVENKMVMVPHAHVPISVHITALSRQKIFDYMLPCIPKGVHYCDTDGFSTGEPTVDTGTELGELKKEGEIKRGYFVAPKVYRLDGLFLEKGQWVERKKVKAKGFSLAKGEEGIEQFEMLRSGEAIEVERMTRVLELFRDGRNAPEERKIKKRFRREASMTKRFYYPDGASRPWDMVELVEALEKKRF